MAFWAYMLRCADGRFYTGHTDDLERRMAQHMAGKGADFTARRQPVQLVWQQDFASRIESLEAERQIKGWSRAKKQALISEDWSRVSELAKSLEARPSTSLRTNGGVEPCVSGNTRQANSVRPEPVEKRASGKASAP